MQSPPFPRYLVPPRSKYSPQHYVLKHPQLPFFPQCQRPSYTPIEEEKTGCDYIKESRFSFILHSLLRLFLFNMTSVHNSAYLRGELQESNVCQRGQWSYRWFIRTDTVLYPTLSSNNISRIDISVDNRACDETTFFYIKTTHTTSWGSANIMQNTLYTAYQSNVLCVLIVGSINKGYAHIIPSPMNYRVINFKGRRRNWFWHRLWCWVLKMVVWVKI